MVFSTDTLLPIVILVLLVAHMLQSFVQGKPLVLLAVDDLVCIASLELVHSYEPKAASLCRSAVASSP